MRRTALAALALMAAAPVNAATHPIEIFWNPQSTAYPNYLQPHPDYVDDFDTPLAANGSIYAPKTVGSLYQEQTDSDGSHFVRIFDSLPPPGCSPTQNNCGMSGQYIGVEKGADYIINFLNGGMQVFSFVFYNLASNDKLTFTFADGSQKDYVGSDILNLNGGAIIGGHNSDIPSGTLDWGRVTYDFLGSSPLLSAAFHSGSSIWYLDDIAFSAPEPGTWAMMILGFGMAGSSIRFRRRRQRGLAIA